MVLNGASWSLPAPSRSSKEVSMRTPTLFLLFLQLLIAAPLLAADQRPSIPIGNSPSIGPENAPVTIIEFIDFQ
jgi:hypothetical protein